MRMKWFELKQKAKWYESGSRQRRLLIPWVHKPSLLVREHCAFEPNQPLSHNCPRLRAARSKKLAITNSANTVEDQPFAETVYLLEVEVHCVSMAGKDNGVPPAEEVHFVLMESKKANAEIAEGVLYAITAKSGTDVKRAAVRNPNQYSKL